MSDADSMSSAELKAFFQGVNDALVKLHSAVSRIDYRMSGVEQRVSTVEERLLPAPGSKLPAAQTYDGLHPEGTDHGGSFAPGRHEPAKLGRMSGQMVDLAADEPPRAGG